MMSRFDFTPETRIGHAFDGHEFGAGPYDVIGGKARLAVDPGHPLNAGIALIGQAPRNADGMVEIGFDLQILCPSVPARGNGWLFYDVLNRGTKRAVQRINTAPFSNAPLSLPELGNRFLMDRGFAIVWSGWQGDVPPGGGRMLADLPVARGITGLSREEFILDAASAVREDALTELSPGRLRYRLSYPAADLSGTASLTWRLHARDPRETHPGIAWRHVDDRVIEVTYPADLDRGGLFEFIYTARDPMVMGLGLAAIRDTVSALRHGAGPLQGIRHALGFGLSQSGRVLRDFLREGFNQDLDGRPVFDAVIPIIAGSRGAFLNMPFAQPGRFSRQHEDHDFPGDQFPFAYQTLHDPISGREDGILARAQATGTAPKIMHMDTDSEFWSARSSLVVTDTLGRPAVLPDNMRFYLAASVAHGDYDLAPEIASAAPNKLTYGCLIRALVAAMVDWVEHGTLPPESRYPQGADLVRPEDFRFPLPLRPKANGLTLNDHAAMPPSRGAPYPVFVPQADADGNSLGGAIHPLLAVPLAAHTGWHIRKPGFAEGDLFNVFGSCFPFADPEARHGSPSHWLSLLRPALDRQVQDRLLLPEDQGRILAEAEAGWWTRQNFV